MTNDPTPATVRAALESDVTTAKLERDWYAEFMEAMRPHMEGTSRTLGEAFEAMTPEERAHAVELGQAAGVFR